MENISIYVVSHKKTKRFTKDPNFHVLGVGGESHLIESDYTDDQGDNISSKNPNFCELTGQYWIWKNTSSDYVGLMHYRRYFYHAWNPRKKLIPYDSKELMHLLKKYDAILPRTFRVRNFSFKKMHFTNSNYYEFYKNCGCNPVDIDTTRDVIKELYPGYLPAYDRVIFKKHSLHYANVIVTRKEIYDKYSAFIFGVLFEVEKRLDISEYNSYQARVFGFISETLMDTFFLTHSEYRIKELPLGNSERSRIKNFYCYLRHKA